MRGFSLKTAALGLVLSLAAIPAAASSLGGAFISGGLTFSGDIAEGTDYTTTTSLSFPSGDIYVYGANGDFGLSGIMQGDAGTISDFTFDLASVFSVEIGGFSFEADALSVVHQSPTFLVLEGTGVLSATGFSDTGATFVLAAVTGGSLRSFSAGITASPIPVPGALVLFGSALAALGWRRRS